ncbi:MAG TPA: MATE family efflux transporter [Synergistaceae bacterium]|jgi:putative MATE family efflux protein|nr:MATE family efflux transporter [Synergistaceae bacterium]NLL40747.1 MATE family efflux transporter [Synergistaceae bacterium]HPX03206.1 MATE family efflux transporter [Synergistaceae bacterium]HQA55153.1 MATE family efflux transporter [Synergistaceae bacterium]
MSDGVMRFRERSLTEGNITTQLILFAIPYMSANLLQALYGAVDTVVVGHFTNAAGLSAAAIGSQFMFLINGIIIGLSMGGTILIARYFGARSDKDIKETIGTMFTLFAIVSIILTLVMFAFVKPLVSIIQTPPEAVSQTEGYIFISSAGISFMFAYNALSAMLRGFGDSKSPLIFVAIASVCNVIGDLIFVAVFKMGAPGAALATILSQGLSAVLAVIYLKKQNFHFDFKLSSFRIKAEKLKNLLYIGLPVSVQMSMTTVSFMFIMATVSIMGGVVASAAIGITSKINGFVMLPPVAFSAAISAMVSQNMGANRPKRAVRCLYTGIIVTLVFGVISFSLLQFYPAHVIEIFTPESELIYATSQYLKSFSIDCILVCFVFCLNGFFNGCGHTRFSMVNNLMAAFLLRVPATWFISKMPGADLFSVGFATPLSSLLSITVGIIYLRSGKWRKLKLS